MCHSLVRLVLISVISIASLATGQLLDITASNFPSLSEVSAAPQTNLSLAIPSGALIGFKPSNASAAQWMSLSDFATVLVNRISPERTALELTAATRDAVSGLDMLAPANATAARNYFASQYGHFPQTTGEKVEAWIENSLQQSAANLQGKGMLDTVARELDNANDAVRKMASLRFTMEHAKVVSDFVQRYNLDQQTKHILQNGTGLSSLQDMYASFKNYVRVKRQAEQEAAPAEGEAAQEGEAAAEGEPSAISGAISSLDQQVSGAIGSVVGGVVGGVGGVLGTVGGGLASGISAIPGGDMVLDAGAAVVSTFTGGFWQFLEIGVLVIDQFVLSFMKIDALFKPVKQMASMAFPPAGLIFDGIATAECFWTKKAKLFQVKSFGDVWAFVSCGMNYISMFKKGVGMIG